MNLKFLSILLFLLPYILSTGSSASPEYDSSFTSTSDETSVAIHDNQNHLLSNFKVNPTDNKGRKFKISAVFGTTLLNIPNSKTFESTLSGNVMKYTLGKKVTSGFNEYSISLDSKNKGELITIHMKKYKDSSVEILISISRKEL